MPTHMLDSPLFADILSPLEMREIFEATSQYQSWLEVEACLAEAQAEIGMIPLEAAKAIRAGARIEKLDLDKVKEHNRITGHPLMGIVRELRDTVGEPHGSYAHWGATTQDIIDSGQMILFKRAHAVIDRMLGDILRDSLWLLSTHRSTLAVARSHGVQALPFTFGFKAASWLDEMKRNRERWREVGKRCLVGSINGAIGTHAPWGKQGFDVQDGTCRRMGLASPRISWQSQRDRVAELATTLAIISATGARIAGEIFATTKTEIGELAEPYRKGLMGSTTMPHKVNPGKSEWTHSLARIVRGNAAVMLESMTPEHERDPRYWRGEWIKMPESFCFSAGVLRHIHDMLSKLEVRPDRMRQNLDMLQGVLLSERAMFVLSRVMPLGHAHDVVHEASLAALAKGRPLVDELMDVAEVASRVDRNELVEALKPENYIGLSVEIADRIKADIEAHLAEG